MEVLNALLKLADDKGLLITLHPKVKERAFMYADDVVIFFQTVAFRQKVDSITILTFKSEF